MFGVIHVLCTNLHALQSTWNIALYKIFKFKNLLNLYYEQFCVDILPINYALDLRNLSLLHKQSMHHMTVVNALLMLTVFCMLMHIGSTVSMGNKNWTLKTQDSEQLPSWKLKYSDNSVFIACDKCCTMTYINSPEVTFTFTFSSGRTLSSTEAPIGPNAYPQSTKGVVNLIEECANLIIFSNFTLPSSRAVSGCVSRTHCCIVARAGLCHL